MTDTPLVSANEISAILGSAAQGYSGIGGVEYNGNPAVQNPLAEVDSSIARIQAQDEAKRVQQHLEQRQDIENMYKMLTEHDGSAFNMKDPATGKNISLTPLPEDKKILDQKASEFNKYVLTHPNTYKFDPEFLNKQRELDQLTRHASVRAMFNQSQGLAAANEPDEENRTGILDNNKAQLQSGLAEFQPPVPYMKKPGIVDWLADPSYYKPENLEQYGITPIQKPSPDGKTKLDFDVTKYGVAKSVISAPLAWNDPSKIANAKRVQSSYAANHRPEDVIAANIQGEKNAKELGMPFVPAAVVTPNGQIQVNPDAKQFAYGLNLADPRTQVKSTEKESKARLEAEKEADELKNSATERAYKQAQIKKIEDDADKDKKDGKVDEWAAKTSVTSVLKEIAKSDTEHDWAKAPLIENETAFKNEVVPANEKKKTPAQTENLYNTILKKANIDLKGGQIVKLPINDNIIKMGGEPANNDKVTNKVTANGQVISSTDESGADVRQPDMAYQVRKDGKNYFVYGYGKGANLKVKVIDERQAIFNYANSVNLFKKDTKNLPLRAQKVYDDMTGGSAGQPATQNSEQSTTPQSTPQFQPEKAPSYDKSRFVPIEKNGITVYKAQDGLYVYQNGTFIKFK